MAKLKACYMCDSAQTNEELTDDNDLSYISVGYMGKGYRMMLRAGGGEPVQLEVEGRFDNHWDLIGFYYPKYCPNCGRKIQEV